MSFADSYIDFLERLLPSRREETRNGIEHMTTRIAASDKHVNIVHLAISESTSIPFNVT